MALISQNFKNDTVSTTIDVKPLIVLATQDLENDRYNILDVFSTDNVVLKDNYDNSHQAKEILDKISSIKNAVDYDKKRLKINTFRFTLKNYFDPTKTLTSSDKYKVKEGELPDNKFVGTYVILYYKSQSTNTINIDLNPTLSNDDCSIMFTGIINRVDQDDKSIKIQAEDNVQSYISDVSLPRAKANDILLTNKFTNLEKDGVISMTYGRADRVPTYVINGISYVDLYNTAGFYTTRKNLTTQGIPFPVYGTTSVVKGSNDYISKQTNSVPTSGYINAEEIEYTEQLTGDIIPELTRPHDAPDFQATGVDFVVPIGAVSDLTGHNSIFNLTTDWHIEDYGGYFYNFQTRNELKYYREDDTYLIENTSLGSGWGSPIFYHPSTHNHKDGRWKIYFLPQKIKVSSIMGLNNYHLPQEEQSSSAASELIIKPLNGKQWKDIIENNMNFHNIYHDIPIDSEAIYEGTGTIVLQSKTTADFSTSELYTEGSQDIEVDKIIMFEYFNNGSEGPVTVYDMGQASEYVNQNQGQGVYKRWTGIGEIAVKEIVQDGAIRYSSVIGRKDAGSTENLQLVNNLIEWQQQNLTEDDVTLSMVINGADETIPTDFENWTTAIETYLNGVVNTEIDGSIYWYGDNWESFTVSFSQPICSGLMVANEGNIPYGLGQGQTTDFIIGDSNIFNIDDNKLMKIRNVWSYLFEQSFTKIMNNVLEYEARQYLNAKVSEGVDVYISTEPLQNNMSDVYHVYHEGFHGEEIVGYYNFKQQLSKMMQNIFLSQNENYHLYGLIDESPTYFQDKWNNDYADLRKCFYRRMLKFIYQADLNYDPVDDMFNFQVDYNLNTFDIDDFVIHIITYVDDVLNTINKGVFDYLSAQNEERSGIYESGLQDNDITILENEIRQYGTIYEYEYQTDSIINKPIDIIIDILRREMDFGVNDNGFLDTTFYDEQSIYKSRDVYSNWKMGFCIHEEIDGKKLIENILSETMSYFTFTPDGKFSLVTLKEKYTIKDIDHFIKEDDILKYKFSKTKKEDLVLQSKLFYRYDNGYGKYLFSTETLKIENLLPNYDGYNYYNLNETTGYKERNLRYHSETDTVNLYHKNYLLNNCNQHLQVKLELPLNYADVKIADIINLPLINNDVVFGLDYSKVQMLNGQPIYPAFIVTSVDIKLDKVLLEAYQLHYLGTDGLHGFALEGEELTVVGNLNEYNSKYPDIHNWNYIKEEDRSPDYTYMQGEEIPYGDANADGNIDVADLVSVVNHVLGIQTLNEGDATRISKYNFNTKTINPTADVIDVTKVVELMDTMWE